MKVAGFVAEFNPFHYGHEYLINKIKKDKVDIIICAMSPNFVMRGEPAIFNKFDRTKVALINGIDIVAEIPTVYTIESADIYCYRGVEILNNLGVTDLYFGVENTNENIFFEIIENMSNYEYKNNLNYFLKEGFSFNTAYKKALEKINPEYKNILDYSNNLLAIEYLKAIKKINSNIKPHFIKRIESLYYEEISIDKKIQSATALRQEIINGNSEKFFSYSIQNFKIHVKNDYFNLIKYKIFSTNKDELKEIQGISEGIENKIKSIKDFNSFEDLVINLTSKRNRETKINRILFSILLNIKKSEVTNTPLEYVRILGFNNTGQTYLKSYRKSNIQIITCIKKGQPTSVYRELDFTKIYQSVIGENIIDLEYLPIIID